MARNPQDPPLSVRGIDPVVWRKFTKACRMADKTIGATITAFAASTTEPGIIANMVDSYESQQWLAFEAQSSK